MSITKGLIIKENWAELILSGQKTMELRGSSTKIRGEIGIIISGTKKIYGTVNLVNVIPIHDEKTYNYYKDNHMVDYPFSSIPYKKLYGWVVKDVVKFKEPIQYNHKQGCVIWVNLAENIIE